MLKKFFIGSIIILLFTAITINGTSLVNAASNAAKYIKIYNDNYPAYLKHDKVLADAFLADYNNSEAQALVARAIWYMENGYMIYGHSKYWDTGFIDCSNFVSLVYKDFGYTLTSASRKYDQVGKKIPGVYSRKIKGSNKYELVGTEKLRPGDILTFWTNNSDGKGTHIGHVAIYMGEINGKPAVIQTNSDRPTAIGIRTDFRYWYGEHFYEAHRVLDDASQLPTKIWQASDPVIPAVYQLPPQKPIKMPESKYMSNKIISTPSPEVNASSANNSNPGNPQKNTIKDGKEDDVIDIPYYIDITGHWAEEDITRLQKNKVISGYPDGSFQPDNTMSRAEFATMLVKALKLSAKKNKLFNDTANHWASEYVATAAGHGIISGYNQNLFGPDDHVTREQMALMIANAAQLDTTNEDSIVEVFTDSSQISDWARNAVLAVYHKNIIKGYPDKTFKPLAEASRAEALTIIVNTFKL
ncbi:MAG: S-layer homology domain-containing protein [Syntrophomonadaceae bacterium]|jgi:cell wall-associated NlpC family hydrolase